MQLLTAIRRQRDFKDLELLWQSLCLIVSFAPAVTVGLYSLSRPVLRMGSDQDLMWVSEALRLLRGLGPSYADHPGAFWSLINASTIKALNLVPNISILEGESITSEGLRVLIQSIRIENALIAGLTGYLCYHILINLEINRNLALAVNLAISCATPTLLAAAAIRHELVSVVFMLISCLYLQKLSNPEDSRQLRLAHGLFCVFMIFAAAFSKQQSLILLPFIFFVGLASVRLRNPCLLREWLKQWKSLKAKDASLLLGIWSLSWAISATPDIDLINLPAWIAINCAITGVISLALYSNIAIPSVIYRASIVTAIIEMTITRLISANWWRQAVTGFPSWLVMFTNKPGIGNEQSALYFDNLYQYFKLTFLLPHISVALAVISVLCSFYIIIKELTSQKRRSDFGSSSELSVATSWLLGFVVIMACLLRFNPPYTIYFFPCLMISSAFIFSDRLRTKHRQFNAIGLLKVLSFFVITCGILRSISNLGDLKQIANAGLPEHAICMSHNMDSSMNLTAVATCPDFKSKSAEKAIFNDWWRGPL